MSNGWKWLVGVGAGAVAFSALEKFLAERRKVYVSFDYENDRDYKLLLQAWHANEEFTFRFNDASSGEVKSNDIGRIKAALTAKIRDADILLVIVGKEANKWHKDWMQIKYRNWINFEIAKAKEAQKKIVAVKIDRKYESPEQIEGAGASWAMSFSDEGITKALREA